MAKYELSLALDAILETTFDFLENMDVKYVTPEALFHEIFVTIDAVSNVFENFGGDIEDFEGYLYDTITNLDSKDFDDDLIESYDFKQMFENASKIALKDNSSFIRIKDVMQAILDIDDNYIAAYLSDVCDINELKMAYNLTSFGIEDTVRTSYKEDDDEDDEDVPPMVKNILFQGGIPASGNVPLEMMGLISALLGVNPSQLKKPNGPSKPELRFLSKFGECLNEKEFKPVIGREEEIELTCRVLARKDKSNPIHVGEAGVGKTAIVHGLVQRIKEGNVPDNLKDAVIYSISLGSLVAGAEYRGEFEKRLQGIIDEAVENPNIILYIDEIHQLVGAGAAGSGSMDGAQILKPYLNDGSIRCIGATTYSEFKKYIEKDAALMRRFQKIEIKEPSINDAISIVQGLKSTYADFHKVEYEDEALEAAVKLSKKFMIGKFLPDIAIDIMDEAGAYINQKKINPRKVTKDIVQTLIAENCNIPKASLENDDRKLLKNLEKEMKGVVFGQEKAVDALVTSIINSRAGLSNENKPMGAYLFVGPTGVGKTEVAKQLALKLNMHFAKFDMSEYMEENSTAKLIGSPAGYVGYDDGGLLTEEIMKHPYSVLLLDEIEKAHPSVYNIFLQVMDDAKLTDNKGRVADFRNVIIIMTSNAGAANLGKRTLGFNSVSKDEGVIIESVERAFTPEFRNRLTDAPIIFNSMDTDMASMIAKKKLEDLKAMLLEKGITLKISKNVVPTIANKVAKPEFGGREIVRIIDKEIKPLFSKPIVFGELENGSTCTLSFKDDKFSIKY